MGLARRLALLTAIMSVLLVLGATEVSLRLAERSRLDDYRSESMALAQTWGAFLTQIAPKGEPDSLAQALAGWPTKHFARTQAVVFVRRGDALAPVAMNARADTVRPALQDVRALTSGHTSVWHTEGTSPAWQVATPLGATPHPYGVLRITVSTRRLEEWAARERRRAYELALLSALLVASGVAFLTSRWVGRPLAELGRAMAQAHGGAAGAPPAKELGAGEFRTMARRYNELREALAVRQRESDARAALLALEERARGFDRLALTEETAAEFAHEIGTPLNTVRGHLQLLRDDLKQAGQHEALERIQLVVGQVDRVASIVRSQLTARVWPAPVPRPIELATVARRMLHFLEPSLAHAGVRASVELSVERPVRAWCDPALVEQILLNLLKNAIEALAPGGHIGIAVGAEHGHTWLDVADDGPGLTAEAQQHLFEPFATTKGGAGTGLGLAVSRRLARVSGGDLTHLPTERGTTWRLTLPAGAVDD